MVRRKLSSRDYAGHIPLPAASPAVAAQCAMQAAEFRQQPDAGTAVKFFNIFNNIRPRVKPRTVLYSVAHCSAY